MNAWCVVPDAARLAQVPVRTVYEWVRQGRMTTRDSPRGVLVSLNELEQLSRVRASRRGRRLPRVDRAA